MPARVKRRNGDSESPPTRPERAGGSAPLSRRARASPARASAPRRGGARRALGAPPPPFPACTAVDKMSVPRAPRAYTKPTFDRALLFKIEHYVNYYDENGDKQL